MRNLCNMRDYVAERVMSRKQNAGGAFSDEVAAQCSRIRNRRFIPRATRELCYYNDKQVIPQVMYNFLRGWIANSMPAR